MTKLLKYFATLAAAALVFSSLPGCEENQKIVESPSFILSGYNEVHFAYGQTREIAYTAVKIASFKEPIVPNEWTCTHENGKFVITAPTDPSTPTYATGSFEFEAVTNEGKSIKQFLYVSARKIDVIVEPANSFIVSDPGARYSFNARRRGNETAETITGIADARIIWTTSTTVISHVEFEDGQIFFSTGGVSSGELEEANALIAALDGNNNILWSWHIWATADNPDNATDGPTDSPDQLDGVRVMARNLGAFVNLDSAPSAPEDIVRSYGLYYQWGRKDPFVGPATWNSTTPQQLYNNFGAATGHTFAKSDATIGTTEYSVANPSCFIAGVAESEYDWLFSAHDNDLWGGAGGSGGEKSLYDPCPAGWRVAPPTIWAAFTTTGTASTTTSEFNVEGDYQYGWTFKTDSGTTFYPAAGRRSFSPSLASVSRNYTNIVNPGSSDQDGYPVGFYWSNAASGATTRVETSVPGSLLAFRGDYVNPDGSASSAADKGGAEGPRSGGFPVRCAAEE